MRTTMLRTALLVTGGAVLVAAACADGGKNPVAPESHATFASGPSYSMPGVSNTMAGTRNKGVIDPLAQVSVIDACNVPLDENAPGAIQTHGHFVLASSGNFHLVCHGELPAPAPPPADVVFSVPCVVPLPPPGNETTGHVVITPSGRVHLVCHGKVTGGGGDPT